jgi:hypothetical protein
LSLGGVSCDTFVVGAQSFTQEKAQRRAVEDKILILGIAIGRTIY